MYIVGILSSPHKYGPSATLAREVLESAEKNGAQIEEIYLPDYNVLYCKGCMNCVSGVKCSLKDDLNQIRSKLEEANGIVLSSPTYGLMPNAMMMNLIQRVGIYAAYRSALAEKYTIGIATAGGIGARKVAKYLTGFTDGLFKVGYRSGTIGALIGHGSLKEEDLERARMLGYKIVGDIENQKKYRFQKLFSKFISSIVLKRIMKRNLEENKEKEMRGVYEYLKVNGTI